MLPIFNIKILGVFFLVKSIELIRRQGDKILRRHHITAFYTQTTEIANFAYQICVHRITIDNCLIKVYNLLHLKN